MTIHHMRFVLGTLVPGDWKCRNRIVTHRDRGTVPFTPPVHLSISLEENGPVANGFSFSLRRRVARIYANYPTGGFWVVGVMMVFGKLEAR